MEKIHLEFEREFSQSNYLVQNIDINISCV